jgi:hypothetical protein
MEPEGPLPHSQVPANCLYPEPAQSSPYPHILLPEDLPYYYHPIYASGLFPSGFPTSSVALRATCPAYNNG